MFKPSSSLLGGAFTLRLLEHYHQDRNEAAYTSQDQAKGTTTRHNLHEEWKSLHHLMIKKQRTLKIQNDSLRFSAICGLYPVRLNCSLAVGQFEKDQGDPWPWQETNLKNTSGLHKGFCMILH